MRLIFSVFVALVILFLLAVASKYLSTLLSHQLTRDDRLAELMFGRAVPFTRVLESVQRVEAVNAPAGCTIVVVEMPSDAPKNPPIPNSAVEKSLQFGGLWRKTPMDQVGNRKEWALTRCAPEFSEISAERVEAALSVPGAYYINDFIGKRLQIYAPLSGFAASFQYFNANMPPPSN